MSINDGGPAFPVNGPNGDHPGMSLRDWFAGQVLNGVVSAFDQRPDAYFDDQRAARLAYQTADAMLKAREEQP